MNQLLEKELQESAALPLLLPVLRPILPAAPDCFLPRAKEKEALLPSRRRRPLLLFPIQETRGSTRHIPFLDRGRT